MIDEQLASDLSNIKAPKKAVTGVPYYVILANPLYARDFSYISCDVPNRSDLIKDDDSDEENDCEQSDLVSIILNLAYIPE